jgi:hypothetical protein
LPDFNADVEEKERRRNGALRETNFRQRAGETKAV